MHLKIRRSDSITSILLFVFNVFLTEKNIMELPLKKVLNILEPFQKNETAIRMGLSRGIKNGLLVNVKKDNEVYYRLTQQAVEAMKYWGITLAAFHQMIPLQQATWNGKWNIVFVKTSAPDEFVLELKRIGYGNWNRQVWVSPYDLSDKVSSLAREYGLDNALYQFQGELTGDKKLGEMVAEIWPVKDINKKYVRFILDLKSAADDLDKETFHGGGVLPFLHLHGLKLFEIIQDDPQLPLQLLPTGWPGIEAFEHFMSTREELLHTANRYINAVLY